MVACIPFEEADAVEDFRPGEPSHPLPVKRLPGSTVSCWLLNEADIKTIVQTRIIWLWTQNLRLRSGGELIQPTVGMSLNKEEAFAFRPVSANATAPASDRIVKPQDNQESADLLKTSLGNLEAHLRSGNDLGNLLRDEADEAAREVSLLLLALANEGIRLDWFEDSMRSTLAYIARKAGEGIVSNLAVAALSALVTFMTTHNQ